MHRLIVYVAAAILCSSSPAIAANPFITKIRRIALIQRGLGLELPQVLAEVNQAIAQRRFRNVPIEASASATRLINHVYSCAGPICVGWLASNERYAIETDSTRSDVEAQAPLEPRIGETFYIDQKPYQYGCLSGRLMPLRTAVNGKLSTSTLYVNRLRRHDHWVTVELNDFRSDDDRLRQHVLKVMGVPVRGTVSIFRVGFETCATEGSSLLIDYPLFTAAGHPSGRLTHFEGHTLEGRWAGQTTLTGPDGNPSLVFPRMD